MSDRETQRVDQWLWFARFFKTRSSATRLATKGAIRVNGRRITKASFSIGLGDVLTFPVGREIRVIRVCGIGKRRGPAPEAATLYETIEAS